MEKTIFSIPKEVSHVTNELENAGFEAFIVGGCVRDLFLNREPKDWDITTNAVPEEIQKIFPESFYENDFGTVGVKTKSENEGLKIIEVTPYRQESGYSDHRRPDKVFFSKKLEDDLKRRDFTINALAYSIKDKKLVDLFDGLKDIKDKVLKTVGEAEDRFKEDALRILRAVRIATEIDFTISHETLLGITKMEDSLKHISRERIRDEFTRIIMSNNPMIGLGMAQKLGILTHISKYLNQMVGVSQEKEAHKYDVFEHSLRALQHAADRGFNLETRLSALFHDIAKPQTKRKDGNKTTYFGHEVLGAKFTRETLNNLKFSKEIVEKVTKMVRWHMFFSDTEQITLTAVRRMIVRVGEDSIWDLMNLRKCDRIGTGRPKEQPFRFRKYQAMIEEALRDPISVKMLKIDGETLINKFHVEQGPKIGYILHALFDEVLDDPEKNTEEYLYKRTEELKDLSMGELEKLGQIGKNRVKEEDNREVKEINKKFNVDVAGRPGRSI